MRRRLKSLVLFLMMLSAYELWNHISPAPNGIDLMLFQSLSSGTASPSEALRNVSLLMPSPACLALSPVARAYEFAEEKMGLRD